MGNPQRYDITPAGISGFNALLMRGEPGKPIFLIHSDFFIVSTLIHSDFFPVI